MTFFHVVFCCASFTVFCLTLVSSSFFLLLWIPIIRHPNTKCYRKTLFSKLMGLFSISTSLKKKNPTVLISSIFNAIVSVKKKEKGSHTQTLTFCKLADNYQRKIFFFLSVLKTSLCHTNTDYRNSLGNQL